MKFSKYFNFFFKELVTNKIKIIKVFFTIFISLLILSSVTILTNSIEREINNNAKVFLGGDFEISKNNDRINVSDLQNLKKDFFVSEIIEFTSILIEDNKKSKTTRIKVVDEFYPLVGEVDVEPTNALNILKSNQNYILIDQEIKNYLNLKLGDIVLIQNTQFEVSGFLKSLPDIGGIFVFGGQALISKTSFRNLRADNLGSFTKFKYKALSKYNKSKIPDEIREDENLRIKTPKDTSQNLIKNIENFIFFLSIISACAILISGIGLKNSLFSFISNNQFKVAIFKSIGFSSQNIKILFYLQILTILVFCSLFSYILSLLIISYFESIILDIFNFKLSATFNIFECLTIQSFGVITFFIFAKPVLDLIDKIKVVDLFRNSKSQLNIHYNKKLNLQIFTWLLFFVVCFCVSSVKPKDTAIFFLCFTIITFVYYLLSKIIIKVFGKIKNIKSILINLAIKNLNTYSNLNSIIVMSMGLGITILLFLGNLSFNINKELNSSIPKNAPDYFFLGLQSTDLDLFLKEINSIDKEAKKRIVPMISARLEKINGKRPKDFIDETNESFWFINGERRISWLEEPPINNTIIEGSWWKSDKENNLKISLDYKVAKDLNIKIGDTFTFNIYGNTVFGVISNFRKVDYRDLKINFAILFNPGFASKIPHEYLTTVKFKNNQIVNLGSLLNKLPNLTYIKLSEYINKTKVFLNKLFVVSLLISSLVVVVGLIVLSNAVGVIGNLKVYQNLVFKILGFEKIKILKLIIFETVILFLPIIFTSSIFSTICSYFFINNIFGLEWYFSFSVLFFISVLFFSVLLLTLFFSNRYYLSLNAYSYLRNE